MPMGGSSRSSVTEIGAMVVSDKRCRRPKRCGSFQRAPEPFELGAAPLFLQPPLLRGLGRLRRDPLPLDAQRLAELAGEALDRELPVPQLAPLVLRDGPQHGADTAGHAALLHVRQGLGGLHVEHRLHARLRLLRVLATRAARTRETQLDLRERDHDRARDADRVAVHGNATLPSYAEETPRLSCTIPASAARSGLSGSNSPGCRRRLSRFRRADRGWRGGGAAAAGG